MRAFKPHSLIAWFVVLNNSFKDHIIGSRLFRFHPEHLRTTYVRAEADDWPTLRLHTTRPHMRKQLKHNKITSQNKLCFFILQGKRQHEYIYSNTMSCEHCAAARRDPSRTSAKYLSGVRYSLPSGGPLVTSTASIFAHHILQRAKAMRTPSIHADCWTTSSQGQAFTSRFTSPK